MTRPDLRTLASKATPGPWSASDAPSNTGAVLVFAPTGLPVALTSAVWNRDKELELANAAYIAAASPDVVLALLDEVERLKLELDECRTVTGIAAWSSDVRLAANIAADPIMADLCRDLVETRRRFTDMEQKWAAAVAAGCVIEKERDALAARVAELETNGFSTLGAELRTYRQKLHSMTRDLANAQAERDQWRSLHGQELEMRMEAEAGLRSIPTPYGLGDDEQAERATAERIAAWLGAKAREYGAKLERLKRIGNQADQDEYGWAESYADGFAADIRAGKWRTP